MAKLKLKNRQIVTILAALRTLPTLKKSPKGTYALAKNVHALSEAERPIQETARNLFKEHFGQEATTADPKHEKWLAYQGACKTLDETETEVDVHLFSRADLKMEENEISHVALADIHLLIDDWSS